MCTGNFRQGNWFEKPQMQQNSQAHGSKRLITHIALQGCAQGANHRWHSSHHSQAVSSRYDKSNRGKPIKPKQERDIMTPVSSTRNLSKRTELLRSIISLDHPPANPGILPLAVHSEPMQIKVLQRPISASLASSAHSQNSSSTGWVSTGPTH